MKRRRLGTSLVLMSVVVGVVSRPTPAQPPITRRPTTFEVHVTRDVTITVRDGTRLAADLYRPARDGVPVEGKFPTLLTRTPYDKGNGRSAEGMYYAARGYNVVTNDVRGRYGSEGTWRLIADDPQDGYDVVEWIAAQPWSDGKVGTFGTSYPGGTQHALAEMNPPHLTAMVPVDALSNCGVSGMRHGGAFELRFVNWIFQIGAPNSRAALAEPALNTALIENGKRIREHVRVLPIRAGTTPLRVVPEYERWLVEAQAAGPESQFWHIKGMSVVDHVKDYADVPVLHVTGWYDSWTRQVSMNYEALSRAKSATQWLVIGPWTHGGQGSNVAGEVEFTPDAAIDLPALRLRWYDRWIRGESRDGSDAAPIHLYVMGTGDDRKSSAGRLKHGGFWRAEKAWPIARVQPTTLYLRGDGALSRAEPGAEGGRTSYVFDPRDPVPTIGGNISSNTGLMTNGGYDQRPRDDTLQLDTPDRLPLSERPDVLVFRSEPLAEDVEVTGTVEVKLWVSSDAPETDFTAKLIDEVPPNPDYPLGFDLNLGDSILRTRYRSGLDAPAEPLETGKVYPLTITLYPTSNVFKRGHRMRVDVSSSNFPRFDVNPNTGQRDGRVVRTAINAVWHDQEHPSQVVLPVVPAKPAESRGEGSSRTSRP